MFFIDRLSQFWLGINTKAELPLDVRLSIERQQLESEKLVSWVLLLLIVFISILYKITPTPESSGYHHTLVVSAIIIYSSFAILRIIFTYSKYLPEWFLVFSAIFDVLILMTLIWSLHIIYHKYPVFYLKAPFISYMYILLALRMLRFDAKYVLIVGFTTIVCYIGLLYYAVEYSPFGTRTRDYAKYIAGEYIYLPGEINKIITIFIVTVLLTLAVMRGRRLLIRAITETRATKELSRFFEPEVVSNIIESNEDIKPGYGKQREAAIIFCDIRGFTEVSKKITPSELMQLLTEYQSIMVKAALNCHGSIDKFLGDGILISFNAITQHNKTYAADALHAAFNMSIAHQKWQYKRKKLGLDEIRIGISVACGTVTVGVVGDMSRLEYTVIGDPVNLSAKLEKHCKIENCEILVTANTYDLAIRQGFDCTAKVEKLTAVLVDGVEDPIDLVILKR